MGSSVGSQNAMITATYVSVLRAWLECVYIHSMPTSLTR